MRLDRQPDPERVNEGISGIYIIREELRESVSQGIQDLILNYFPDNTASYVAHFVVLGPDGDIVLRLYRQPEPQSANEEASGLGLASELPTRSLTLADASEDSTLICGICKDDRVVGDEVTQLPCQHVFDTDCIAEWLIYNQTCPMCRRQVVRRN